MKKYLNWGIGCVGVVFLAVGALMFVVAFSEGSPAQQVSTQAAAVPEGAAAELPARSDVQQRVTGTLGDRIERGGIAVALVDAGATTGAGTLLEAAPGNEYIIIEVVIENISRDEAPYNVLYWSVKDGEGYEYSPAVLGVEKMLQDGTLRRGDKVRGRVAFEVPQAAEKFVFTYEPLVILGGYEPIQFALQRK